MNISNVDKKLIIEKAKFDEDIVLYDINDKPFKIYGLLYENGKYRRVPEKIANASSSGVTILHTTTPGGRVKFKTDSTKICLHIEAEPYTFPTMPICATDGFDIYVDNDFQKVIFPSIELEKTYSGVLEFKEKKLREITIYFPIYCPTVSKVYVGLKDGCVLEETKGYKEEKPIVYYGSSIEHGCCASKSSAPHWAVVERWTNINFWCLGFSGNGNGEPPMMDYVANMEMSAFVMEYHTNFATVDHLEKTHLPFYKMVREKHPDIPILIISFPEANKSADSIMRNKIAKRTYDYALEHGDKNVRFIDGHTIYGRKDKCNCTVDACHPTDLGFYRYAKKVYAKLKEFDNFIK